MQYHHPAIEARRPVAGRLGDGSVIAPSDQAIKTGLRPVRWDIPAVEDRREVSAALGRPSLIN